MTTSGPQTQRGRQERFVVQFSIPLPNQVGQLAELMGALREAEVEVAALCQAESTEWAVMRMIFTDPSKARDVLLRRRLPFSEREVLAVVLDRPAGLESVCKVLVGAELNVHVVYPMLLHNEDRPVMVFHVDDHVLAVQALTKHGFSLLDHHDL